MIKNLKVQNVNNNGREVPNQFLLFYEEENKTVKIFKSYKSMIVKWENGEIIEVGKNWDYSRTTGKYRNILTGTTKKEFEKMLEKDFKWNDFTQSYLRK